MKTKKRKASPSVLIVLIVSLVLIVSVTFAAIFQKSQSVSRSFSVSNLAAQCVITFVDAEDEVIDDLSDYKTKYGVIASVDPTAPNYIGNMRVSVQYSGAGTGLIRVRMAEEWSTVVYESGSEVRRTVRPHQIDVPYTLSAVYSGSGNQSAWYDNRLNDYCFYYATPVYSLGTSTIPMITGLGGTFDLGVVPSNTEVRIMAEADVVQVNRYPQYWGMNSLPWTSAVSAEPDVSLAADE